MLRVILTSIILPIFIQAVANGNFNFNIKNKSFIIYNIFAIFVFYSFLNIIFWNYELNFLLVITFFFILSLTMYYVHEFRGTNINFSDVLSLNTAKEVAGGYKYEIKPIFIITLILIIGEYIYQIKFFKIELLKNYFGDINGIGGVNIFIYRFFWHEVFQVILFLITIFILRDKISLEKYNYSLNAGEYEGYIYNFISSIPIFHKNKESLNILNTKKAQNIGKILKSYKKLEEIDDAPHIIVIMNESFGSVHSRISTNKKVTPYYDNLNGVIKGNLCVNTFGGGTANTEFEFLTCMTIGNYPYPVMPYNNFVKKDKYSLARYFDKLGYETMAMHPYTATNYHRDKVYKRFGFRKLLFYEDFKDKKYVRNFVSDESMYEEVIRRYEKNLSTDKKLFLFGITMQNHSGYNTFDGETITANIENVKNLYGVNSYLSLMNISDSAIKILIDYFKNVKEHVIILFFGDHNASFGNDLNKILYENDKIYECTNAYYTPFFIYDNKTNTNEYIESISANFLSIELLKKAKLPFDEVHNIINDIYKEYTTFNFHKAKKRENNKLYDIKDDLYMDIEREYLND